MNYVIGTDVVFFFIEGSLTIGCIWKLWVTRVSELLLGEAGLHTGFFFLGGGGGGNCRRSNNIYTLTISYARCIILDLVYIVFLYSL